MSSIKMDDRASISMACSSAHSSGVIVARRHASPSRSPPTHRYIVVYATGASCDGVVRDARRVGGEQAARSEVGWLLFQWLLDLSGCRIRRRARATRCSSGAGTCIARRSRPHARD